MQTALATMQLIAIELKSGKRYFLPLVFDAANVACQHPVLIKYLPTALCGNKGHFDIGACGQ